MSIINQRTIHSISTGHQSSEPLPKDMIIGPAAGSSGTQYIQRRRYIYQWSDRQEHNLDRIQLYQGTITPLPSQIRFYRNRARRVIAIFENGHDIEPPLLEDSQIPHATIITTWEFLCDIPPVSATLQESSFNFPERSSCREISNNDSPTPAVIPSHSTTDDTHNIARGGSSTGLKRRRETHDDEGGDSASKRPKSAAFACPVIAFVLGVAVGAINSNVILGRVCGVHT